MEHQSGNLLDRVLVTAPWLGEKNAEALVTEKFLHVLAQVTGQVTVVTQDRPRWTICPCPSNIEVRTIEPQQCPPARQPWWYRIGGVARQSVPAWNWAQATAESVREEIRQRRYSLLISRYLPPDGTLAGYLIRQTATLPWWCILNDPFPAWCQPALYRMTWNFARIWRDSWYARKVLATDRTIFTYPAWHMRNHIIDYLRLSPEVANRIDVLYHVGIPNHLQAEEPEPPAAPVFRYFGGFYHVDRDPRPLIYGWRRFQQEGGGDCELEIYGNEAERLGKLVDESGARNVRLCKPVPYREACRLAQQPCILLQVDPNRFGEGIWVASKFADYLGTGNIVCGWVPSQAEEREIAVNAGLRAFWASTHTAEAFALAFRQARAEFLITPTRKPRIDVCSEQSVRGQILEHVGKLAHITTLAGCDAPAPCTVPAPAGGL